MAICFHTFIPAILDILVLLVQCWHWQRGTHHSCATTVEGCRHISITEQQFRTMMQFTFGKDRKTDDIPLQD
jgi:hypothetical protein